MLPCSALRGMQTLKEQHQYLTSQGQITPKPGELASFGFVLSTLSTSKAFGEIRETRGGGWGYLFHGFKKANANFSGEQGNKDIIVEQRGTSQFNSREQHLNSNNDTRKYTAQNI